MSVKLEFPMDSAHSPEILSAYPSATPHETLVIDSIMRTRSIVNISALPTRRNWRLEPTYTLFELLATKSKQNPAYGGILFTRVVEKKHNSSTLLGMK
jgi:hypothetical protein